MFESTPVNPPDAIFGLTEEFKRDPNPDKINLTVGMYQDESGNIPVMNCVHLALQRLLETKVSYAYLPIDGLVPYNRLIPELILGETHSAIADQRVQSAQTPGGTAALRIAGELLRNVYAVPRVWISDPTWANHPQIFRAAGLEVCQYDYLDSSRTALDFERFTASLAAIPEHDAVVLHAVCHNPTGVDPTNEQWRELLEIIRKQKLIPIFDFAYQGFGEGIDADARAVREFCQMDAEALVCNSFSKNFNLYGERVGGITAVTGTPAAADAMLSQIKLIIRTMYSNPPTHGATIVSSVLSDEAMRKIWVQELDEMRIRITRLREDFVAAMGERVPDIDFHHINKQRGMFSYSGISGEAVDRLKNEYSIYLLKSGRINVAGINAKNLDRLSDSVASVLQQPV